MNRYAIALDWCDRLADRERARDEPPPALQHAHAREADARATTSTKSSARSSACNRRARRHQGAQLDAPLAVQFGGQPARKVAVDAVRVGERLDTVGGKPPRPDVRVARDPREIRVSGARSPARDTTPVGVHP